MNFFFDDSLLKDIKDENKFFRVSIMSFIHVIYNLKKLNSFDLHYYKIFVIMYNKFMIHIKYLKIFRKCSSSSI